MCQAIIGFLCRISAISVEYIKRLSRPVNRSVGGGAAIDVTRSKKELIAENALLRQQVAILRRNQKRRPRLSNWDRIKLICLARLTPNWQQILHIVQPDTLLRWHRDLFRMVWRWKLQRRRRKPRIPQETFDLIRQMAADNLTWGAERIRGELLKLGIKVSKRTVQKHMRRSGGTEQSSQTWSTFLKNHASVIWACDFVQVYDLFFRWLFVFVVIEHASRRIVHVAVTAHPTDAWVAQQLREAAPWGDGPDFLIRDNDRKYGSRFSAVAKGIGIKEICIPFGAPNANAICERFIGSLRRECLDHVLILNQRRLHAITREFVEYYNTSRPHQGIGQAIPISPADQSGSGTIVALPILGGLHHDYRRAA